MIPCMLFTKCAATLASNRSLVLIGLPLTAILQVTHALAILPSMHMNANACTRECIHAHIAMHDRLNECQEQMDVTSLLELPRHQRESEYVCYIF